MNIKELRELIQVMKDHDLVELEIEKEGEKIRLKKNTSGVITKEQMPAIPIPTVSVSEAAGKEVPAARKPQEGVMIVRSPMVGTCYAAPASDQDPYVTKGQMVAEGDVLCIIEAMKLMNEIKSDVSGKILEILVENGMPVEFDQPLFKIEKA